MLVCSSAQWLVFHLGCLHLPQEIKEAVCNFQAFFHYLYTIHVPWACSEIDHRWCQMRWEQKSGTRGIAAWITCVFATFWHLLLSITVQTHGNIESIFSMHQKKKKEQNFFKVASYMWLFSNISLAKTGKMHA